MVPTCRNSLLLLSALAFALCLADHGSSKHQYDAEQFKIAVEEKPHFIMFFAPWCGHCKRLAPTWDELADIYNYEDSTEVYVAKVDCTVETALCSEYGVKGYPTLKFLMPGKDPIPYNGKRDKESLESFMKASLDPSKAQEDETGGEKKAAEAPSDGGPYELSDVSFPGHIASGHHFVMFYAPWCGHCKRLSPTWTDLAKEMVESESKVKISKLDCTANKDTCGKYEVKGYPTLIWFKDGDKVEKYSQGRDLDTLKGYVLKMVVGAGAPIKKMDPVKDTIKEEEKAAGEGDSKVVVLNGETFADSISKGVTFVMFFAPWCGHCKRLAPTWDKLATEMADTEGASIAKIDCTVEKETCGKYGVRGYPTLILFRDGEKVEDYNKQRELGDLKAFVLSKLDSGDGGEEAQEREKQQTKNKVQEEEKVEAEEDDSPSNVHFLNSENFDSTLTATGLSFVKFFAPWCGHCKRLAPTWEELADKLAQVANVKIIKVDCTVDKDVCSKYEVKGYPTLKLFRGNSEVEKYSGGRDLDSLHSYVLKNLKDEL